MTPRMTEKRGCCMKRNLAMVLGFLAAMAILIGAPPMPAAGADVTLDVMNPRGEITPPKAVAPVPRVSDLAGKRIGIYWNRKAGGNNFWDVVETELKQRFPTAKIVRFSEGGFDPGDKRVAAMVKEVDTFLYGVGD